MNLNITIPMPKYRNKVLSTNLVHRLHWSQIDKIKKEFKKQCSNWFLSVQKKKVDDMVLTFQVVRKTKRKFDATNLLYVIKWFEDLLTEMGYQKDDKGNKIVIEPTVLGSNNVEDDIIHINIKELDVEKINWK